MTIDIWNLPGKEQALATAKHQPIQCTQLLYK